MGQSKNLQVRLGHQMEANNYKTLFYKIPRKKKAWDEVFKKDPQIKLGW